MKKELKLAIEPIPVSTWGVSLASKLPSKEWNKIRNKVYEEADWTCEVCGQVNQELHAHERWGFDLRRKIQHLIHIDCLCKTCHDVKHFGRSSQVYKKDYTDKLILHWCRINGKTKQDFNIYCKSIFELNRKRADIFFIVKVGNRILA